MAQFNKPHDNIEFLIGFVVTSRLHRLLLLLDNSYSMRLGLLFHRQEIVYCDSPQNKAIVNIRLRLGPMQPSVG